MTGSMPPWRVPFVRPDLPTYDEVAPAVRAAFESGSLTKGKYLLEFESAAARCTGTSDAVGVSSCTTGLMLVLRAVSQLRGRLESCPTIEKCPAPSVRGSDADRDEVIVPSFIFLAAPAAIVWAGLRPVFVDVDPATYTVDPGAVASAITPRTAAIVACHTFGCPCDIDRLAELAERARVPLIIDAAHGFGASRQGRHVGAGALAQVFSLSPTKLVVAGEGGIVATSCSCLAELIRVGREYGNDGRYGCDSPGMNGRLPEVSAIIGKASLERLPEVASRRRAAAATYREELRGLEGVVFQRIPDECDSSWKDFCIEIDERATGVSRDALSRALAQKGIDTRAYYSPACHQMRAFGACERRPASLPTTDRLAARLLALPMGGHVTPAVACEVAREILAVLLAV